MREEGEVGNVSGGGKTPLVLVVGFLGAGKTTFLRELLPRLERAAVRGRVLINDYRNARVDAASLAEAGRVVRAVSGDCVCCSALHELRDLLLEPSEAGGEVVLVEANGTTDPFPLIEFLAADPDLRRRYGPLVQMTLVDALRWQKRAWHNELERLQLSTASHAVVSRQGLVSAERLVAVREAMGEANPAALEVDLDEAAEFLVRLTKEPRTVVLPEASDSARHELAHAYCALELPLPEQVPGPKLLDWLRRLPDEVLRVKGVAQLAELPGFHFLFQRVAGEPAGPTMSPLPMEPTVPPMAILIGSHLPVELLRQSLSEALGEVPA